MNAPVIAFIGLGGNLGDAAATVRAAVLALDALPDIRLLRASRLYRTPAWGITAQPDFINAVAMVETQLSPRDLLDAMLDIEHAAGRERNPDERWGPRTLDLDLLLYADAVLNAPGLHLPHPRLHERAFALLPLLEIAPDIVIPGIGPGRDALAALDVGDIQALT